MVSVSAKKSKKKFHACVPLNETHFKKSVVSLAHISVFLIMNNIFLNQLIPNPRPGFFEV
jgi:hypothetical protein